MVADGCSVGEAGCSHQYRYAGLVASSEVDEGECERPYRLVCVLCSDCITARCGRTSRARCGPCSERHRRRVAVIAREGLRLPGRSGRTVFVTLTAPGVELLPWDRSVCSHGAGVQCSGKLGCRVVAEDAARFNSEAPRRWDHLRRDLARLLDVDKVEAFGSWELQDRGVLHRHAAMVVPEGLTQRRFMAAVKLCAMRQGFGRQVDVKPARQGVEWYLAKYATKSVDDLPAARYVDQWGEVIVSGAWRPWSQSRGWWLSMGALKAMQAAWWRPVAGGPVAGTSGGPACGSAGTAAADGHGAGAAGDLDTYSGSSAGDVTVASLAGAVPM